MSCQEEVAPTATPGLRRGLSAAQPQREGCGTRTFGPQTVLALFPVAPCAARRRKGPNENHTYIHRRRYRFRSVCYSSPSCSAEQRSGAGGPRRGLSEGRSPEFRSRPAARVAQGTRQSRARNAGVAFFLVTFSWRPKKKLHAVRAEQSASAKPKRSQVANGVQGK